MSDTFPAGWYCVAARAELHARSPTRKHYFGRELVVAIDPDGLRACAWRADGRALTTREVLDLVFVWHDPADAPAATPAFELPWARLADARWQYAASPPRRVAVELARPFADYFDHWHTRVVHRIPLRTTRAWFAAHTCGVSWQAVLDGAYTGVHALERLPLRLASRSNATLYGAGLAVDELDHAFLTLVNVQTNTPIAPGLTEMRSLTGVRAAWAPPSLGRRLAARLLAAVLREVDNDLGYWLACAREPIVRDAESEGDLARYRAWFTGLEARSAPWAEAAAQPRTPAARPA